MSGRVGDASRQPGIAVVWLEKYAVYRQDRAGNPVSVDYMLLNEVIPSRADDMYQVRGYRGAESDAFVAFGPGARLSFVNEWLLDRKARSHDSPKALDDTFPNTSYRYRIEDAKGIHELTLELGGIEQRTLYPDAPRVSLHQQGRSVDSVDWQSDASVRWTPFETVVGDCSNSPLFAENTIFILIDNARGETVYTSGSGNKDEPMSPRATEFCVPAGIFEPGMRYTVFVCFIKYRSTDTVTTDHGVISGVAVNSAVTELGFRTSGIARNSRECPPIELQANYRWPGKLRSQGELVPWPVDDSGLHLPLDKPLRSGGV